MRKTNIKPDPEICRQAIFPAIDRTRKYYKRVTRSIDFEQEILIEEQ